MIDAEWLQILCCPETRQKVVEIPEEQLSALNQQVTDGQIKNRDGRIVQEIMETVLIREDGKIGYPVRQGIPVMLISEGLILGHH